MRKLYIFFILLSITVTNLVAVEIPSGLNKNKLVNDLADVIPPQQEQQLEQKLDNFARTTSTQILVLTVKELDDDPTLYAAELGHEIGVGQKKYDNGIVVLVKEKTPESGGKVAIATGYGVEHLVTDALSKRIIENEMIPEFRKNDYYTGIDNAVNVLINLTKGEYTADAYVQQTQSSSGGLPSGIFFLIFIVFIVIMKVASAASGARRMKNTSMGRSNLPFFLLMLMSMNSGSRHSGSWNSFNSGSGGFSGGGGFGGFGGGGFGGGGASGSW